MNIHRLKHDNGKPIHQINLNLGLLIYLLIVFFILLLYQKGKNKDQVRNTT